MKIKKIGKIAFKIFLILIALLFLFTLGTYIYHRTETKKELELLKEKGYYNPVSVGDYSLNVAKFGNSEGAHTIVSLAGLEMGDFSVTQRQMTSYLEDDNLVVFVDRAGYGFSDDTENEMTLEYIVEDYRKALRNAGIKAPYILMAHSIGGVYATYWSSTYPDEIEAVIFLDGTQLSENVYEDEPSEPIDFGDKALAFFAKLGFGRYALREYNYLYPDNFSEEEQKLGDALSILTLDSIATVSESYHKADNGKKAFNGIVTNDIPKLYICASWGFQTADELNELMKWRNRQVEINNLDVPTAKTDYKDNDDIMKKEMAKCERLRQEIIYPYAEKMGSCEVVCLPGDHAIYAHKPDECGKLVSEFIDNLGR